MTSRLELELNQFLDAMELDSLIGALPEHERPQASETVSTFMNEAIVGLRLMMNDLDKTSRILEVGAGLCFLSIFLKEKGYQVTALEPLDGGFGFFDSLKQRILDSYSHNGLVVVEKRAEQLTPHEDGEYDLIFSSNVIEHIAELDDAMLAMASVLLDTGKMIHGCPNHVVPYEPHVGLPIISWLPKLTELFWKTKLEENSEMWKSLNFVTYFKIRSIARRHGFAVKFKPRLTYDSFLRLSEDPEFRRRHESTLVGKCLRVLELSGTLKLTRYLPAWLNTPMIFTLTTKQPD
ncbi:MAG: methyltransferase domain-containing protein [Gammaproteobacteria bacterium]|nr:methyltransferase domain-containing protein [Gammaproteobacteria bacterium]